MPKLIDLEKVKPIDFPSTEMDGLDVVRYLNTLPTVDAVEVVHGRWITTEFGTLCSDCTRCYDPDFEIRRSVCRELKYCPNCGAKMDGVSDG